MSFVCYPRLLCGLGGVGGDRTCGLHFRLGHSIFVPSSLFGIYWCHRDAAGMYVCFAINKNVSSVHYTVIHAVYDGSFFVCECMYVWSGLYTDDVQLLHQYYLSNRYFNFYFQTPTIPSMYVCMYYNVKSVRVRIY